jgi:hypothetical protein
MEALVTCDLEKHDFTVVRTSGCKPLMTASIASTCEVQEPLRRT